LIKSARVLRGASWNNNPQNARVADRNHNNPTNSNDNNGVRFVAVPSTSDFLTRILDWEIQKRVNGESRSITWVVGKIARLKIAHISTQLS